MKMLRVRDVYGREHWVSAEDWNKGRIQTPLRFRTGRRYLDVPANLRPEGGAMIHRENVAEVLAS